MSRMFGRKPSVELLAIVSLVSCSLVIGCGQDPAFTESGVASADGSEADQPEDMSSPDNGQDSSVDPESAQDQGGAAGEDSSYPTYTPPPGYPPSTPQTDVLVEDGGSLTLPGVKAVKVGINFEDLSDFDLNDSVLCFTGDFKIQGASVVSYKKQTIVAAVTNNSACGHNIHVTIKNRDGLVTQKFSYNDRVTTAATMNFDVGSSMWVVMENQPNNHGCIGPIAMNHASRAEVKPNLCRR